MMRSGDTGTVLGRTTRLRGDLECEGDLQIDGEFTGSIRQSNGRVLLGAESHVRAHIVAQDVVVMGTLEGDIRATGRVDLRSTAVVTGDVFSGRLSMEENAMLQGQVDPSRSMEREIPPPAKAAPKLVEAPVIAPPAPVVPVQQEFREPEYFEPVSRAVVPSAYGLVEAGQPESRPSEHRQALPLRESSASHRIWPGVAAVASKNERQLPSALAAFAAGGRRDLSEFEMRASNEKMWHNSDTE